MTYISEGYWIFNSLLASDFGAEQGDECLARNRVMKKQKAGWRRGLGEAGRRSFPPPQMQEGRLSGGDEITP